MRRHGGRRVVFVVACVAGAILPAAAAGAEEPPAPPLPVMPTVCLDHDPETAADYNAFFARTVGMWRAGDVPHRYPLPDGRVLWLLNDSFLSPTDSTGPLTADSGFVHNAAFVQSGNCVTALAALDADRHPHPFFADPSPGRWYWPLGGVVQGDKLLVFLAEMSAPLPLSWTLRLTPTRTMIATVDWRALNVDDIRPAPDAGAALFYRYSVVDDGTYTYLFGNNLVYGDNTETSIARVPTGRVTTAPHEYWNGPSTTRAATAPASRSHSSRGPGAPSRKSTTSSDRTSRS
jgi:hypothetical protein